MYNGKTVSGERWYRFLSVGGTVFTGGWYQFKALLKYWWELFHNPPNKSKCYSKVLEFYTKRLILLKIGGCAKGLQTEQWVKSDTETRRFKDQKADGWETV